MPTTNINNDIDLYKSLTPTVFKKIDVSDVNVYPFNAHKSWTVYSGSATSSCLPLNAIYTDTTYLPALGTELTFNDLKNIDDSLQSVTYFSVNRLFYKCKTDIYFTLGPSKLENTNKRLYNNASILSFPYNKVGDGIKNRSFELTTVTRSININLKSTRYGDIYDSNINTGSIISDVKFYEGFNEYFDISRINKNTEYDPYFITGSISFSNGINTTDGTQQPIGYCASFNGSGSYIIHKDSIPGNYDRATNYAISFFISASNAGTNVQNIITKKPESVTRTPYSITLTTDKKIQFAAISATYNAKSDFIDFTKSAYVAVTSSTAVSSSWNHVVCQKSGSYLQIYLNGVLQSNTLHTSLNTTNSNFGQIDCVGNTYVGGWVDPLNTLNNFVGKLDEVRVYNKSLTSTEIGYLTNRSETGSMLQTNVVGNIFEQNGIAVISSPNYLYDNILQTPYTASYKSTVQRNELSVLVKVGSGDFNLSLNPSLIQDDGISYQPYISSSNFHPYVTTIGLYDDSGNLVAVSKLANPIQKRNDVDINFLIQLDLDNNITTGNLW